MKKVLSYLPLCVLLIVGGIVIGANYTPNTFLSGWDTLHPEFNFPLAFSRAFFGVLRPEQGLGAVAGHSHMADLPHIAILFLLSSLLPQDTLRYAYIFICYILGPIGMYLLLTYLVKNRTVSLLGSLFYMLNIGTVQLFYVPFEMFVTQFAILPFLFFFAISFVQTLRKRPLIGFILTTIFASPTAFAAPLWYIMFGVFVSYLSVYLFINRPLTIAGMRDKLQTIPKARREFFQRNVRINSKGNERQYLPFYPILLILIFLLLNLYWILPNFYFALVHGNSVTQAAANQLFSEEAFLYNKAFGNLSSVALLKTFYFNWQIFTGSTFTQLFAAWKAYFTTPILFVQSLFFILMALGMLTSILKKQRLLVSFLPGVGIALIFLLNDTLPFHMYRLFEQIPLFQEAFRFPDDKVLGIYVFLYTIFLTVGISVINNVLKRFRILFSLLFACFIFFSAFPVFQGQLIQPAMRIQIPEEYFALFDYMQNLPQGRIATLPIQSLYGWEYYNWQGNTSFQGSGFLPFGLSDATMDRDFDRWNSANESYYHELSYAVYSQNQQLFLDVLKKYDISYVVLDTSITSPGDSPQILFYKQLTRLLHTSHIKPIAEFHNHLFVFATGTSPLISYTSNLPTQPGTVTSFIDTSYLQSGNYITTRSKDPTDNLARLTSPIIEPAARFTRQLSSILAANLPVNSCPSSQFNKSDNTKAVIKTSEQFIEYTSVNGQYCDHVNLITHHPNAPLFLTITSRNLSGLSLRLCVRDATNNHCIIESKLPASAKFTQTTFAIPPLPTTHFSVILTNIGIQPTTSINDIATVSGTEEPPITLPALPLMHTTPLSTTTANNSTFLTLARPPSPGVLLFSQSYEPGWQLYAVSPRVPRILQTSVPFLVGQPVSQHILVNSWENGWILSQSSVANNQLMIVFLPQYLEYLGFGIGCLTLLILIVWIVNRKDGI